MDDETPQLGQASSEASKLESSWDTQSQNEHWAPGREGRIERVPGAISPPGSLGSWCHRRLQRPTAGGPSFPHLCAQSTQARRGHFGAICKQITCKTPDSRFQESRAQLRSPRQSHAFPLDLLPLRRELAAPQGRRAWSSGPPNSGNAVRAVPRQECPRAASGSPCALCKGTRSGHGPGMTS